MKLALPPFSETLLVQQWAYKVFNPSTRTSAEAESVMGINRGHARWIDCFVVLGNREGYFELVIGKVPLALK